MPKIFIDGAVQLLVLGWLERQLGKREAFHKPAEQEAHVSKDMDA